ncbi:hypothetical protein ISS08_00275 [Candidatus Pacearchaeota archaeon]|nr:hypothetical protein [Candidatus Pacearchaeota archaeon]
MVKLSDEVRNSNFEAQIRQIYFEDVNRTWGCGINGGCTKGAILSPGEGVYDLDANGYYANARRESEEGASGNLERC